MDFWTTGDIAKELNIDRDVVAYALRKASIQPVGRAGQVRLFSAAALEIVEHHLEKLYKFKNFRQALDFVNKIGELAEQQGHHPDIYLAWGKVKLEVWTHKIKGLHESDFIFAAKADTLYTPELHNSIRAI